MNALELEIERERESVGEGEVFTHSKCVHAQQIWRIASSNPPAGQKKCVNLLWCGSHSMLGSWRALLKVLLSEHKAVHFETTHWPPSFLPHCRPPLLLSLLNENTDLHPSFPPPLFHSPLSSPSPTICAPPPHTHTHTLMLNMKRGICRGGRNATPE